MSGHIGIIATDAGRYTLFAIALSELQRPVNTRTVWQLVNDRAHGRNSIVEKALNEGTEWVLFLDDDHAFPHTLLQRLLSHDLPVVGSLYLKRQAPFVPVAYAAKDGPLTGLRLSDLPADGLVPVRAMGTGGMLIRAEVLREVGAPWFENETGKSEDIVFCEKLWRLRVPMHVDTGCRMGHLSMMSTWPSSHPDGSWTIGFQLADGFSMQAPIQDD